MGDGCNVVVGSSSGTENGEPISIACCCAACEEEPAGGKAPACVWDSSEELCLDRSSSAILFPDRFAVCFDRLVLLRWADLRRTGVE